MPPRPARQPTKPPPLPTSATIFAGSFPLAPNGLPASLAGREDETRSGGRAAPGQSAACLAALARDPGRRNVWRQVPNPVRPAVRGRLGAVLIAIIANDLSDAQAIGAQDMVAPERLRRAVRGLVAPRRHGRLVAPEGEGEELARFGEAFEPLDRQEAIDRVEPGTERGGEIEIMAGLLLARPGFEQDGDHGRTSGAWGAEARRRNRRSSRRMNFSRRLKA